MGPAAGKLYFEFGISLNNSHCFQQRPNNSTASSATDLRGSIALPVPVAAAIRLLPVTAVVVAFVVLQPAVFTVESSQSIRPLGFQQFPVSPVTSPRSLSLSVLWNPNSKDFGQVQVGGKTFFGPRAVGLPYSFDSSYFNSLREYINLSSYLRPDHRPLLNAPGRRHAKPLEEGAY